MPTLVFYSHVTIFNVETEEQEFDLNVGRIIYATYDESTETIFALTNKEFIAFDRRSFREKFRGEIPKSVLFATCIQYQREHLITGELQSTLGYWSVNKDNGLQMTAKFQLTHKIKEMDINVGRWVAILNEQFHIILYPWLKGQPRFSLQFNGQKLFEAMKFIGDSLVTYSSTDAKIRVWSLTSSLKVIRSIDAPRNIFEFHYSPNGLMLVRDSCGLTLYSFDAILEGEEENCISQIFENFYDVDIGTNKLASIDLNGGRVGNFD